MAVVVEKEKEELGTELKEVIVEPMNYVFGKIMEILTIIGLIAMFVPGIIYIVTGKGYLSRDVVVKYWGLKASAFWKKVMGIKVFGYSWFLSHLTATDCLSIFGVCILAVTPLISLIGAEVKADKKYKVLIGILIIEFLFAIFRPILMGH